jgi:hypothetical protein
VPDLYVRYGGCALSGTSSEIACVRGASTSGSGGSATQDGVSGSASSTLFYVFADGFPLTGGEYTLRFDP